MIKWSKIKIKNKTMEELQSRLEQTKDRISELIIKLAQTISDYKEIDELNKAFANRKISSETLLKSSKYYIDSVNKRWNN
ncbi:MAG: hypothetical protein KBH94_06145 [Caldisericia bacterium]|nr:hypothetical protein [Caldisericia bacterium]